MLNALSEGATAAAVAGLGIVSAGGLGMLKEIQAGQLVPLLTDWEMGMADVNIVMPAGRAAKPSARAFAEFIAAELKDLELSWKNVRKSG